MGFFETKLADNVMVNLESEAQGGLAKGSKGEKNVEITPENAFINVCKTMGLVSAAFAARVGPVLKQTGSKMDLEFGIKADPGGNVMVSSFTTGGQFKCTLKLGG